MKRFFHRQWNLRSRAIAARYARFKTWCVEVYIVERAIYKSRQKGRDDKPGGVILTHKGARIAKVSRQLRRSILRQQEKRK